MIIIIITLSPSYHNYDWINIIIITIIAHQTTIHVSTLGKSGTFCCSVVYNNFVNITNNMTFEQINIIIIIITIIIITNIIMMMRKTFIDQWRAGREGRSPLANLHFNVRTKSEQHHHHHRMTSDQHCRRHRHPTTSDQHRLYPHHHHQTTSEHHHHHHGHIIIKTNLVDFFLLPFRNVSMLVWK